ncbi:MAG: type I glyceraldehyde-3-phosphate dehydrogenase [Candidatus Eisenbacteria bacterium]|nr:type I glyceraldehyde-3-phosphate dehydrogenase [Candidatus Eisenbacteria bacterium]
MAIRIGINGFGRIGRLVYRAAMPHRDIEIVAINDVTDAPTLAHLLKYDSVHGRLKVPVTVDDSRLMVDGRSTSVLATKDPAQLPWKKLGVDLVVESTGIFTDRDKAALHLSAGARKVIVSAPSKGADLTLVMGVNHRSYDPATHHVVSNASCTTNCLAPVAMVLNDAFGIQRGVMTTIHAYTNDQRILDLPHQDLRRARAAALNQIPSTTGAAKTIGLVVPELKGKLDGLAIRVPVPDGSLVDLTVQVSRNTTVQEVNAALKAAADGPMRGIIEYSTEELVSSDVIGNPHSSVVDSKLTNVVDGNLVKVFSWYDNEWAFSVRVVELIQLMAPSL